MPSIYSTSSVPQGIQIYANATLFPVTAQDGEQAVAADTNTLYIYDSSVPGWQAVANPGAAVAIDALTGEVTATGPGIVAATISNAAVTNAKLAAMADNTVKGNKSGGPASPSDLALADVAESVSNVLQLANNTKAVVGTGNLTIQVKQSSAMQDGYLSSADWSSFDARLVSINGDTTKAQTIAAGTGISVATALGTTTITNTAPMASTGNLTGDVNANISILGGTGAVIGGGASISQSAATSLVNGYLTSTDWGTFNGKVSSVSGSAPISSSGGTTPTISISQAGVATNGYLSSTDWNIFNNKQSSGNYITALTGEVTANGPGSVAATIANSAVTNAKMANMANNTIKGNVSGISAAPSDLTATQATAMLNQFTSLLQGLVPASGGGTSNFLRADGTWAAVSGLPSYSQDKVLYSTASAAEWRTVGTGSTDSSYPTNTIILGRTKPVGLLAGGTANTIVGAASATALTTGYENTIMGSGAAQSATTSYGNTVIGFEAGKLGTLGSFGNNLIIGYRAGYNLTGSSNIVIGAGALGSGQANGSSSVVAIGNSVLQGSWFTGGVNNSVGIGDSVLYDGGSYCTAVGFQAATQGRPSYAVALGLYSMRNGNAGAPNNYSVAVGSYAGQDAQSANSVFLGSWAGSKAAANGEFYLDNRSSALASNALEKTNSLMYGQFNATPTSQTLRINAQVNLVHGERHAVAVKTTTPVTVQAYDYTIAMDTATIAGVSVVNLPTISAADAGRVYNIKDLTGSGATNTITVNVAAASGNLIDGASSKVINTAYGSMMLQSDGSNNWMIL